MKPITRLALIRSLAFALLAGTGFSQATQRVSLSSSGTEGDDESLFSALSADGRIVAFESWAANLVPGDGNGLVDVFVRDVLAQQTSCVSVTPGGAVGNSVSSGASISGDGRFVAFESLASDLVAGDANNVTDIFVRDRLLGVTTLVSVASNGLSSNSDSREAAISVDGRFVAFESLATNLVPGDTNMQYDVFVHDRQTAQTIRASLSAAGLQCGAGRHPSISARGRFVVFVSGATDVVVPDVNLVADAFVRDLLLGTTTRVSVSTAGVQANQATGTTTAVSSDGRFVAFASPASNLVSGDTDSNWDAFVRDLVTGETTCASVDLTGAPAAGWSDLQGMSLDGRFVAFYSGAANVVHGDTNGVVDAFLRDRWAGQTTRVSVDALGGESNGNTDGMLSMSADGRYVAFDSRASNLVPGDANGVFDVFLRDRCSTPVVFCSAKTNSLGCTPAIGSSGLPSASAGSGFTVTATQVMSQQVGLFLYSLEAQAPSTFQGGWLCLRSPLQRTVAMNSGGNPPPRDCSGSLALDFNAHVASGVDPRLLAGVSIYGQMWSRDPGFAPPNHSNLTEALHAILAP
ncbi:MAG: calcium-binding protein [Planctomycetes bacterium]|nr:calcium-binding protein [Planctomycetota bacterium]